jgi:hypothetical protein
MGPSDVFAQSNVRMRSPISPPPEKKAGGSGCDVLSFFEFILHDLYYLHLG